MTEQSSHRQILRSTSIIGGASVANIAIGLIRTKVAAILLGPGGVGLIGLLQSLLSTAAVVASLGFGTVGTRQIAEAVAHDDEAGVAAARRALFWGTLGLTIVGGGVLWSARAPLARFVLGDAKLATEVGWLALALALTVGAGSQVALLYGLRRIGDLARISVFSSVASTFAGVGALVAFGRQGLVAYVIAAPLMTFLLGHLYVARLPRVASPFTPWTQLTKQWSVLAKTGSAFMLASLTAAVAQLVVRAIVKQKLGVAALGNFQAAWMISMTYIGFILGAMGTDFYPRLTAVIQDHSEASRIVNEQTEVALLLGGPVFLATLGLAPWIIHFLYSDQFSQTAVVLRWQILGDIVKLASWPLGFVIMAAGDGKKFLLSEGVAAVVFAWASFLLIPIFGLKATGISFFIMYSVYLPVVYCLARRRMSFVWTRRVVLLLFSLLFSASATFLLSVVGEIYGLIAGLCASGVAMTYTVSRLWQNRGASTIHKQV